MDVHLFDDRKIFLSRIPPKLDSAKIKLAVEHKFGDGCVHEISLIPVDEIDDQADHNSPPPSSSSLSPHDATTNTATAKIKEPPHKGYGYCTFVTPELKEIALTFGVFDANPNSKRKHNIHVREIERNESRKDAISGEIDPTLAAYSKDGSSSSLSSSRTICYLWTRNICPHHESCKFEHVGPGGCVARAGEGKAKKCFTWWKEGNCAKGDSCKFAHEESTKGKGAKKRKTAKELESIEDIIESTTTVKKACFNFLKKGKCRKGENCPYSHDESARTAEQVKKLAKKQKVEVEQSKHAAALVVRPEGCVSIKIMLKSVAEVGLKRSVVEKGLKELMVEGVKKVKIVEGEECNVTFKSEGQCEDAFIIVGNSKNTKFGETIVSVDYNAN